MLMMVPYSSRSNKWYHIVADQTLTTAQSLAKGPKGQVAMAAKKRKYHEEYCIYHKDLPLR